MKRIRNFELIIGGVCLLLSLLTMGLNWTSPVARALRDGQRLNGFLIGSDYEDNTRHSDTMMFISYDPRTRFLDVLSIPRDTMLSLPDRPHIKRINEIFAYEFRHSGRSFAVASTAVKNIAETILSSGTVQGVTIPYFVTLDYSGFRALIDALGGVYIRVVEPMHYDDNWGHLHIHLNPGTYLMNGHTALEYVRFRGSSADQGRVLRQQLFVKEVLSRMKTPWLLWRLPEYARILLAGLHTNFSRWDLFNLLMESRRVRWKNLRLFSLPGAPYGKLWKMDPESTRHIVSLITESSLTNGAVESAAAPKEAAGPPTVEVFNASTHAKLANVVTQLLREKGFDVVVFGNYSTRQQRTLVIDRSGKLRPAQAVAEALRAASPEVISRVDPSRQVDVSVVLGNDYPVLGPQKWNLK